LSDYQDFLTLGEILKPPEDRNPRYIDTTVPEEMTCGQCHGMSYSNGKAKLVCLYCSSTGRMAIPFSEVWGIDDEEAARGVVYRNHSRLSRSH